MLTGDPSLLARCRVLASHGLSRSGSGSPLKPQGWSYEVLVPGFKYNMTDIQAAIGLCQLRKLAAFQKRRREIVDQYQMAFAGQRALQLPVERTGITHAWHLYAIRLNLDALRISRDDLIEEMASLNIETSVHFMPVHLHPYYRDRYGYAANDFPRAVDSYRRLVSLPLHPGLSESDVADVVEAVLTLIRRHER
jgi:dTDP-4-amino-4,6-dideoxygalactose transaminase